jgi:hypothetical protein
VFVLLKPLCLGLLRPTADLVEQILPLSVTEAALIAGSHIAGKDTQITVECQQNRGATPRLDFPAASSYV